VGGGHIRADRDRWHHRRAGCSLLREPGAQPGADSGDQHVEQPGRQQRDYDESLTESLAQPVAEPVTDAEEVALKGHGFERYATFQSSRSPFGWTMFCSGSVISATDFRSALTRISITSDSRR
jgi:hypothetical protein